jgi:GGDEF domain-containing protein
MDADNIAKFRDMALLELKRAERYRKFLSLLVLNLSEFVSTAGRRKISTREEVDRFMESVIGRIRQVARETDLISGINNRHLVMLLPETDRVGAEAASTRFQQMVAEFLSDFLDSDYEFDISVDITSFPDQSSRKRFRNRLRQLFDVN